MSPIGLVQDWVREGRGLKNDGRLKGTALKTQRNQSSQEIVLRLTQPGKATTEK